MNEARLKQIEKREEELNEQMNKILTELKALAAEKVVIITQNKREKAFADVAKEIVALLVSQGVSEKNAIENAQTAMINSDLITRNGYDY